MQSVNIYEPEEWRLTRLNELREELHVSGIQFGLGRWDLEHRIENVKTDIAFIEGYLSWYGGLVQAILDAARNGQPDKARIHVNKSGELEAEKHPPTPEDLLRLAGDRYGDTRQRLEFWLARLANFGYLSQEQARQFDIVPPKNERIEKEAAEEREQHEQWREDFDEILKLVARHAEKSGQYSPLFAQRRAVAVWNLAEHPRRDQESIKSWCNDLRHESPPLLPAGAWVRASARLLVQRLKDEVLGK